MRGRVWLASLLAASLYSSVTSGQVKLRSPIWIAPLRHDQATDSAAGEPTGAKEVHDCRPNWNASTTIKNRLFQLGAPIEDWPPAAVPREQCLELQVCAERLRLKALRGYVLGGQIASRRHQPSTVQLWLVDISWARVMISSQRCFGCEEPDALARQAATLAQRIEERHAPWMPLASLSLCSAADSAAASPPADPAPALPAVPPALLRPPVLLAIYGAKTAERDRLLVNRTATRTLGLLGRSTQPLRGAVHPEAPRSALRPAQHEHLLLDIELLYSEQEPTLTEARLRLSDGQHARQSTIHCIGSEACTPAALARQVQLQVAVLSDAFDELNLEDRKGAQQTEDESNQPPLCLPVLQCITAPKV